MLEPITSQVDAGEFLASAFSNYISILAAAIAAFGAAWYGAAHNEAFSRKRENRKAFGNLFAEALGYANYALKEWKYWKEVREDLSAMAGRRIRDDELWKGLHGTLESSGLPPHAGGGAFGLMVEFDQMDLLSNFLSLRDACLFLEKTNVEHAKVFRQYVDTLSGSMDIKIGSDGMPQQSIIHERVKDRKALSLQPELQRLVLSRAESSDAAFTQAKEVVEQIRHFAGVHQKELGLRAVPDIHLSG